MRAERILLIFHVFEHRNFSENPLRRFYKTRFETFVNKWRPFYRIVKEFFLICPQGESCLNNYSNDVLSFILSTVTGIMSLERYTMEISKVFE